MKQRKNMIGAAAAGVVRRSCGGGMGGMGGMDRMGGSGREGRRPRAG